MKEPPQAFACGGSVTKNCMSLRTSAHTGVAIPRIYGKCCNYRSEKLGDCHVGLRPPRNDTIFDSLPPQAFACGGFVLLYQTKAVKRQAILVNLTKSGKTGK